MQGLIGKHSLSPLVYEDGLKELEDFISNLNNPNERLKTLSDVRNEFREELKAQPLLLKECIKNDANLGQKEIIYCKFLLDGLSITNGKTPVAQSPALDKSAANRKENNNSKLRNITKLLFCNPARTVTLFLASQAAFASAATIKPNNSSGLAVRDSNLPFNDSFLNASEIKHDTLVKHKTQMKDNVLKAIEESQISMRLEYKDATENLFYPLITSF